MNNHTNLNAFRCRPEPFGELRINSVTGLGRGTVNAPPQMFRRWGWLDMAFSA
jgi:hypothetical protein